MKKKMALLLVSMSVLAAGLVTACAASKLQVAPGPDATTVGLRLIAQGFVSPVGLVPSPDGTGRLFVVDQAGAVSVLKPDGAVLAVPFLDILDRMVSLRPAFDERGLLGFAFHPLFRENGRFFVYYSAPLRPGGLQGWDHTSTISEFRVSPANPDLADPNSERVILQVDEPQFNHNAGQIAFGPDGFLHVPLGDGGAANDTGLGHSPGGNGQDMTTLLGKILRIDVDSTVPYGIPADNPFVGKDGRDEIFALGFRNPFRISFDMGGTHELFAADAGQNRWEEVDLVIKGGNYGWNIREGAHSSGLQPDSLVDPAGRPLIDPIIEYPNAAAGGIGTAVIGGFVYRGAAIPGLQGAFIFGDFNVGGADPGGTLFLARRPQTPGAMWERQALLVRDAANGRPNGLLRSFGQDAGGELYVLTADTSGPSGTTGKILKIVP